MKITTRTTLFVLLTFLALPALAEESVVKQFLRYVYGADGVDIAQTCLPSDDLWMLRGARNTNTLAAVDALSLDPAKRSGIFFGLIRNEGYFVEVRDGKVDPAFSLESQYQLHRMLAKMFLYAALRHDQHMLGRLTTDAGKVEILGPKDAPPAGDMDVYEGVLQAMPVVRCSKPADDLKSRTVTYRVPLGEAGLNLLLTRQDGVWKIDTSKSVKVSLAFFYQ
jgi:hypothetical protein